MDKSCVSREQFDEIIRHQLKSWRLRKETYNLIVLKDLGPGYYSRSSDVNTDLLLQCGLCRQAATDPFACYICFVQYCRRCIITMINAKKVKDWETNVEVTGSPVDQFFDCLNKCKEAKVIFYLGEEIKNINEKFFKCPIVKCEKKDQWTRMANHVLKCQAGEEYEVNFGEWRCKFMA